MKNPGIANRSNRGYEPLQAMIYYLLLTLGERLCQRREMQRPQRAGVAVCRLGRFIGELLLFRHLKYTLGSRTCA